MDDRALYISNYRTEIVVPLTHVALVSENLWVHSHPVTIEFHAKTEFGSRIVFEPKARLFAFRSPHPVVQEIRDAVSRANGGSPGSVAETSA